jgi:hypothetical protein
MTQSDPDGWSFKEDFCAAGGKSMPFPGRDETLWLVKVNWPSNDTMGRLILREYESGEITIERGRVWMPQADGDDGDGA